MVVCAHMPEQSPEAGAQATQAPSLPDHDSTVVSTQRTVEMPSKRVGTLVVVRGAEIGRIYPLRRSRVVLGRGQVADIVLPDREVSRTHIAIEAIRVGTDIAFRLIDLDSTNHVFVNGVQTASCMLQDGDKIHLGETLLTFELHDAIDTAFHTEIRNRIHYDDLTGLLTFESFRTALSWELDRYANSAKGCAVVMMDLDDFKHVNDTRGHQVGSAVIHSVGALIRGRLRQFDVGARYGGEEFVAYLPETDAAEATTAAERLRLLIANHTFVHQEHSLRITISMGISHFPEHGKTLEPLIEVADQRLYEAKRSGKNRVVGGSNPPANLA